MSTVSASARMSIDPRVIKLISLYQSTIDGRSQDVRDKLRLVKQQQIAMYESYFPQSTFTPLMEEVLSANPDEHKSQQSLMDEFGWYHYNGIIDELLLKTTNKSGALMSINHDIRLLSSYFDNIRPRTPATEEEDDDDDQEHKVEGKEEEEKEHKDNHVENLDYFLDQHVPNRKIFNCPPDGSCGFTGVVQFLRSSSSSFGATELRGWLYEKLTDPKIATDVNSSLKSEPDEWEKMMKRISSPCGRESWMTADILRALSHLLGRNIFVIDVGVASKDRITIIWYPAGRGKYSLKYDGRPIMPDDIVLLLRDKHFDALVNKSE